MKYTGNRIKLITAYWKGYLS